MFNKISSSVVISVPKEYHADLTAIYKQWGDLCDQQDNIEDQLDENNPEHVRVMLQIEERLRNCRRQYEVASRLCMEFATVISEPLYKCHSTANITAISYANNIA